jgi:hypothetical protein
MYDISEDDFSVLEKMKCIICVLSLRLRLVLLCDTGYDRAREGNIDKNRDQKTT